MRKIITLCGSTKFKGVFEEVRRSLTLMGHIVIGPEIYGHADGVVLKKSEKEELDKLHLDKIDLADTVYVINPHGYIGESTAKEIEYARSKNKEIKYLDADAQANKDQIKTVQCNDCLRKLQISSKSQIEYVRCPDCLRKHGALNKEQPKDQKKLTEE